MQTGRIDSDMASSLSRTENLRLKADYTGTEIDASVAKEVVGHAETFVRTVERVFGLEALKQAGVEKDSSQRLDRVGLVEDARESDHGRQSSNTGASLEERGRQAAENWRRDYYDKRSEGLGTEPTNDDASEAVRARREQDTGLDFDPER